MGAVVSLLWGYVAASYLYLYPQNSPAPIQNTKNNNTSNSNSNTNSPTNNSNGPREIDVGRVDDLVDGEITEFSLANDKKILFVKLNNQEEKSSGHTIRAFGSKCTHLKQNLKTGGAFYHGRLRCSLHGACFSVYTGDIEDYPGCDNLPIFPVREENGRVLITVDEEVVKRSAITKRMVKQQEDDKRTFVIIGGGPAGATAAETLRAEGFTGAVVLINKEPSLAYDRTKYSKVMNTPLEKALLRPKAFYDEFDITCMLGTEVTELDVDNQAVHLSDGGSIKYDQVLIATGADCQKLSFIPGHNAKNVFTLRTHSDGHNIYNLSKDKNVLIVGSSFIGMEVASCIVEQAKAVTVIGMEGVPFERVLGKQVGLLMQKFHESRGVKFIMQAICKEFKTEGDIATSVVLKDDTVIPDVDMIVLGAGVTPAVSFIKSSKINIGKDRSVMVDEYLSTGIPGVWAAGDLARFPYAFSHNELVRIEHYGMAQTQGAIAAKNMVHGPKVKCTNIPFFWSSQFQKSIRYCGHALSYDEILFDRLDEDVTSNKFGFVAFYLLKDRMVAACSLNRDPVVAEMAELMNANVELTGTEIRQFISEHGSSQNLFKSKLK